ncbi:cytochrome P450, family 714, subfamily A, polypeptide 1 [Actinidia rufa]|uniref:Cytochrome P450, family 714, subfamily A, polypeptide 1 n=1 Tax=Actinidia rufa TaxID=165716 RepID=A0A7J0FT94_9ERIC|nr:cytochrome P450, family 714, subfamily A, polypeptide 1 [Actinidia rufa]
MDTQVLLKVLLSIGVVCAIGLFVRLYNALVKKPERVRAQLRKQGITGPPPAFLVGNILEIKKARSEAAEAETKKTTDQPQISHNYEHNILPFFDGWRKKYGKLFTFSLGNKQILHVNRADIVKEITRVTSLNFGRPSYHRKELGPLFGEGILTSNGPLWQYQKKILAPELHMDKVKGMTTLVWDSAAILLDSWKSRVEAGCGIADIHIDQDLLDFSGDVISRACFGSNYSNGQEIFCKLNVLKDAMAKRIFNIGVPGLSSLPTKNNRLIWGLVKEIHTLVVKVVKERKESEHVHKDLLQTVLEGAENGDTSLYSKEAFVVDNCKNIYLAAQETVAITAAWCLVLLASNPEWQARVRAEVIEIWGGQIPDSEMLRKVKQLTMVIQETLRLYPPGVALSREALKDVNIAGIDIPQGVNLWTMVMKLHTDPETWGPDSHNFNPERFANGISAACKVPQSYMPFGFGPRVCLGQNLAMLELKMIVGLLLSNFSLSISPKYVHSPVMKFVIEPKHGINLLIKKL